MNSLAALGLAACCMTNAPARAADVQPRLGPISVQLFYETTGVLSDNIAPPAMFTASNTSIGEGDAREPANDLLVTARLTVPGDEANSATPLTLKATGPGGKVLAARTFASMFFKHGKIAQALFVPNAVCAGKVRFDAVFGAQRKTVTVDLKCGE